MIEILDIESFGPYRHYEWKKNIGNEPGATFKQINIIYGRNYSGKTTLSRIFRSIENSKVHPDYDNPNFLIKLRDGRVISQENIESFKHDFIIRVYNTDFVKTNLSWFFNDDGSIMPFTLLGEKNIEIEKKLLNIERKFGSVEDKKGLLFELNQLANGYIVKDKEEKDKRASLDSALRKKAQEIKNKANIFDMPLYNIISIKTDIVQIIDTKSSFLLCEKGLEIRRKLINEEAKKNLTLLKSIDGVFSKLVETINHLISKRINPSEPIMELINDNLLQEWVRMGIERHKGKRENCGFCGKTIEDDLWNKLDAHFSKESEELRNSINLTKEELLDFKNVVDNHFNLSKRDFYVNLHVEFEKQTEKWINIKGLYMQHINFLLTELEEREKDIFKGRELLKLSGLHEDYGEILEDTNKLILENNNKTLNLNSDQVQARIELRMHEVARYIEDIKYIQETNELEKIKRDLDSIMPLITEKEEEVNQLNQEKRELETLMKDECRGAELVNKHLSNYFGHDELTLVAEGVAPNVRFKIIRGGKEAKNLSEGECSLISFCYFIAQIEDELKASNSKESLIIYIDDPISSLDGNHIFFMFSLIESIIAKNKNFLQLFISTHSLDFLKYLKRLTNYNGRESVNHFLIEKRMKLDTKCSFISPMPAHIREYVTEFNYLFSEIYSLYKETKGDRKRQLENTYNQFYNLPNNIRKFLECYLFYKYPNNESPLDNLPKLFEGNIPTLLNRVINEYSHLVYIDRGWKPVDVDEMERCVQLIIDKMRDSDPEQFYSLLESIGVKDRTPVEMV
ncbi:AAA family ATPase [Cytobacillus suaedae]|nr:AAA family ATPase [Cytobacillus suaedae]